MDSRTQERVERWESRPYAGGRDELATLADEEFSGAVAAVGTWLFMLNGRIVGVVDGDVTDATQASGTIYEAPADALPLLMAMLEQGGETRGTYYTNETPLSEVDRKLQQGSFTGYVELSEQVLSGDYYAVYYGGRRMSAAYIGNAERLLTGEEAFERADDEIGLYEVVTVDVSVTDVPGRDSPDEPAPDAEAADATDDAPDTVGTAAGADPTEPADAATSPADADPAGSALDGPSAGGDGETTPEREVSYADPEQPDENAASSASSEGTDPGTASSQSADRATERDDRTGITTTTDVSEPETSGITTPVEDAEPTGGDGTGRTETGNAGATAGDGDGGDGDEDAEPDERFKEEERWRETRRIPSIDPDNTTSTGDDAGGTGAGNGRAVRTDRQSGGRRRSGDGTRGDAGRQRANSGPSPEDVASTEQALRSELEREDKVDQLVQRVTELEERRKQLVRERDELRSENEELTDLVEQLQARIEELESKLEQARAATSEAEPAGSAQAGQAETARAADRDAAGSAQPDGVSLNPRQAFEQTNVFVRYESKSQPTLESAHDGEGSRGDLARNLQLERHTQFDAATAAVDGQPYETFVEESMRYRFVEWLVGTCLFEIRETGHASGLADLYDVIPRIDRIELSATISLEEDDTENVPDQVTFDVAAFDKRGTPLVVANCNDSRDPATRGQLEQLEADASAVCANYPDLGAAVVVTSSFFDPGALELAEEVTTSGFLNRSSKHSYVNLSRKQGYHFCLIESRSGGFHLSVPEL